MIKEVKYNGYSASPSDYECADGDLAMSLNAINEDGALRPVLQPKTLLYMPEDYTVKCVHETSVYKHYIIHNGTTLQYVDDNEGSFGLKEIGFFNKEIFQVTPIGNTLAILTPEGIYYFLWKENEYINLGNELPELDASPYISTQLINTDFMLNNYGLDVDQNQNNIISGSGKLPNTTCENLWNKEINTVPLQGTERQNIYSTVFAVLNFQSDFLKNKGFFLEPFYVRFAYRMYDGSHVKTTAPVLLAPTTMGKPFMRVMVSENLALFDPTYFAAILNAKINLPPNIDLWKDIITDIDVFVTEPLVDYSDNPESLSSIEATNDDFFDNHRIMNTDNIGNPIWVSLSEYKENLSKRLMLTPYLNLPFKKKKNIRDLKMWGKGTVKFSSEYGSLINGYFAIENKGYTIKAATLLGQEIPSVTLPDFESTLSLTIFNIKDVKGKTIIYSTEEEIDDDTEFRTFLIINTGNLEQGFYINTKRTDEKSFQDVLVSYNNFYRISEISLSDITNNCFSGQISLKERVLNNLLTHQTLSDLGQGHNDTITKHAFSYNNRLNIILDKERFKNPSISLRKQNPAKYPESEGLGFSVSYEKIIFAYVEIFDNTQKAYVEIPVDTEFGSFDPFGLLFFSFPNSNAKNLVVFCSQIIADGLSSSVEINRYTVQLKRHDFLNLSYAFDNFNSIINTQHYELIGIDDESNVKMPSANDIIEYGNIIRLSDVNNPFRFSEEYSVSLPVSKIYALSTAAKALSQGQFGQYPLYAFTSDGIWALEITSTGTYQARQPISRDVVINPASITQIDSSVLFATDRGIMLISGSQVICISDRIDTEDIFLNGNLPKMEQLLEVYNSKSNPSITLSDIKLLPLKGDSGFLKDCRMIYDYPHQHIIVYNPAVRYAYVYSFKSQLWGMMFCDISDNVNSYPEALAVSGDRIVDFSGHETDSATALLITRPFKMGEADIHKTISTIIQRGNMNDRNITQVLYGSNDLNNWFAIWSSNNIKLSGFRGTPYKHYRIVIIRKFDKSESLYGFSVQYEHRLTNRLR